MTICKSCGDPKEPWELHNSNKSLCKDCGNKRYNKKPTKKTNHRTSLRSKYGLEPVQFEYMLRQQGGRCKICGTDDPGHGNANFSVDHCHTTGKIRGLLCTDCNIALGRLKDNPIFVERALSYLRGELK